MRLKLVCAIAALLFVSAAANAAGPYYQYYFTTRAPSPNLQSGIDLAADINLRGDMVGQARLLGSTGRLSPMYYDQLGNVPPIDFITEYGVEGKAAVINDDRVIAGTVFENVGGINRELPVVWESLTSTRLKLDLLAPNNTGWGTVHDIGPGTRPQIVGESILDPGQSTGRYHAVLWEKSPVGVSWLSTDLGTLADNDATAGSGALGVNANGDIVGWSHKNPEGSTTASLTRAFYKPAAGAMMDLGLLPGMNIASTAYAESINDAGVVVGWMDDALRDNTSDERAFIYSAAGDWMGEVLPPVGYTECRLTEINNQGIALGRASKNGDAPEPMLYMIGAGSRGILFEDLIAPGFENWDVSPRAINDRGRMAIGGRDWMGERIIGYAFPMTAGANAVAAGMFNTPGALPAGWSSSGPGDAMVVTDPTDGSNNLLQMTTGSPILVSQQVDTPAGDFAVAFDLLFTTDTGTLQVMIGTTLIAELVAPDTIASELSPVQLIVDNPALFNLADVTLSFTLDGPTGSQALIDNIALQALVTVPEPASLALMGIAALGAVRRRGSRIATRSWPAGAA
jgi:uncharacterized membrane protein